VPELPDVEGFRRVLTAHAVGRPVERVRVDDPGVLRNTTPQGLGRALRDRRFAEPRRHGKWLAAPTDGATVLFHFGMSGALVWDGSGPHPHDRAAFVLPEGELRFRDQRKLRGIWLARDGEEESRITGPLGPDALGLRRAELAGLLAGRRGAVKGALMDQAIVAGLGNLLADEILWRARIHPRRSAARIGERELGRLHRVMQGVLRESVRHGRVPPKAGWLTGVRDDRGARCPRCGAVLEGGRIGGRTARWCPRCQPD